MAVAANAELAELQRWVGRSECRVDPMPSFPAEALAATLDREERHAVGEALPPLWHWIYLLDLHRTDALGHNGHVRYGEFLPPMPFPRRMFAGARLRFVRPLRLGRPAQRISTIERIEAKSGRSGPLIFMRVRVEIESAGELAIEETQDIVYRRPEDAGQAAVQLAAAAPVWEREVCAGEALLFRYSALIFNAHRIHWDRSYAEREEGYPGLVVHGQLIATWLADLVRLHDARPLVGFEFRSLRALFDGERCRLCGVPAGDAVQLWAENGDGAVVMQALARFC